MLSIPSASTCSTARSRALVQSGGRKQPWGSRFPSLRDADRCHCTSCLPVEQRRRWGSLNYLIWCLSASACGQESCDSEQHAFVTGGQLHPPWGSTPHVTSWNHATVQGRTHHAQGTQGRAGSSGFSPCCQKCQTQLIWGAGTTAHKSPLHHDCPKL